MEGVLSRRVVIVIEEGRFERCKGERKDWDLEEENDGT